MVAGDGQRAPPTRRREAHYCPSSGLHRHPLVPAIAQARDDGRLSSGLSHASEAEEPPSAACRRPLPAGSTSDRRSGGRREPCGPGLAQTGDGWQKCPMNPMHSDGVCSRTATRLATISSRRGAGRRPGGARRVSVQRWGTRRGAGCTEARAQARGRQKGWSGVGVLDGGTGRIRGKRAQSLRNHADDGGNSGQCW
jgi:hypothetical protein